MKLITRLHGIAFMACVFLLPLMVTSSIADENAPDAAAAELTAMLQAFLANSTTAAAHESFWAEDLVYTASNGTRFGKAEIMQGFADTTTDDENAAPVVYSGEDVRIRVYGDSAVVAFRLLGTPVDGSSALQYFNTGTFLRREGKWQVVAWQATSIPARDDVD